MKTDSSAPGSIKLSDKLAKLPRVTVTQRPAVNANASRVAGIAYEINSAKKVSEAFRVKGLAPKG